MVRLRLAGPHHGHLKGDEQRRGEPDEGPGPLHALQATAQRHLVGLLGGIGAVRVREVDVRVGVVHDALDVVAAASNDVRVVRVADVHFHDHTGALRLEYFEEGFEI